MTPKRAFALRHTGSSFRSRNTGCFSRLGGVSSKMFSKVAFRLFAIESNGVPILHRIRRRRLVEQTGFEPLLAISDIQTT
jgi:hypothetical protein